MVSPKTSTTGWYLASHKQTHQKLSNGNYLIFFEMFTKIANLVQMAGDGEESLKSEVWDSNNQSAEARLSEMGNGCPPPPGLSDYNPVRVTSEVSRTIYLRIIGPNEFSGQDINFLDNLTEDHRKLRGRGQRIQTMQKMRASKAVSQCLASG